MPELASSSMMARYFAFSAMTNRRDISSRVQPRASDCAFLSGNVMCTRFHGMLISFISSSFLTGAKYVGMVEGLMRSGSPAGSSVRSRMRRDMPSIMSRHHVGFSLLRQTNSVTRSSNVPSSMSSQMPHSTRLSMCVYILSVSGDLFPWWNSASGSDSITGLTSSSESFTPPCGSNLL